MKSTDKTILRDEEPFGNESVESDEGEQQLKSKRKTSVCVSKQQPFLESANTGADDKRFDDRKKTSASLNTTKVNIKQIKSRIKEREKERDRERDKKRKKQPEKVPELEQLKGTVFAELFQEANQPQPLLDPDEEDQISEGGSDSESSDEDIDVISPFLI